MSLQPTVVFIMKCHIFHDRLSRFAGHTKICIKVPRQTNSVIILKMLIQLLHEVIKRVFTFCSRNIKIFQKTPCSTSKRTHDVQNGFTTPFSQLHFVMIQGDPTTPFPIVLRLSCEGRDERIPQQTARARFSRNRRC